MKEHGHKHPTLNSSWGWLKCLKPDLSSTEPLCLNMRVKAWHSSKNHMLCKTWKRRVNPRNT
eukprot:10860430-Karenia_brevis.AAC.1